VLLGMNILFDEKLARRELVELAAGLGSDVPFMLSGGTALAWSRGDRFVTLSPLPAWPVLICVPGVRVDTAEAYGMLDPSSRTSGPVEIDPADFYSLETLKGHVSNDFQRLICKIHPEVAEVADYFSQFGGEIVSMSGTGSAVFALFPSERTRTSCLKAFGDRFEYPVFSTRLSAEGIQVDELD